jgi:cytochrome c556
LAYRGGSAPEGEAAQQAVMQAWMSWFGELGDAVVDGGAPFGASTVVGGSSAAGLTGYSVISADSLDAATAMAGGCPILTDGGSVDVYEAMDM